MNGDVSPVSIWQKMHWSFFVHTQGLIISLSRFQRAMKAGKLAEAKVELLAAADLMRASGAAMQLAGDFSREQYQREVRTSMLPPAVGVDNFSGLMSWDHASLIQLWRNLRPVFQELPDELREAHQAFVSAYGMMAGAHRVVCDKFVGSEAGSIRHVSESAVEVLDRFERSRLSLVDPNNTGQGCPLDPE